MALKYPLSRRATIAAVLVVGTCVLALWGTVAHEKNITEDMTKKEHLVALKMPMQALIVRFTEEPELYEIRSYPKGSRVGRVTGHGWNVISTPDWALLNGGFATSLCPGILTSLVEFNNPDRALTLEQLKAIMAEHQGVDVKVWAHVPRFTAAPGSLSDCKHFGYDATTQFVTYKGKPIALMADTWLRQPRKA